MTDKLVKELKKDLKKVECLGDVLELDLKYCGDKGTSMEIQDMMRDAKYKYSMDGLRKVNLDSFASRFYNFSMQGFLQIYLDDGVYDRLVDHLPDLSEYYNIPLSKDNILKKPDIIIFDVRL